MSAPKFSKNSAAMKLLRRKFETGEITGTESRKAVYGSESLFQKHRLNTFRFHYSALRKEFSKANDDYDKSDVRGRCSQDNSEQPSKKMRIYDSEEESYSVGDDETLKEKPTKDESRLSFLLLHTMSIWKEHDTMTKRVTVAIVLPSGVDSGEFSIRMVEGGQYLEVTVRWPRPLIDLSMMHKKWLTSTDENYQVYHPEFVGFQDSLKLYRARSTDWIDSSTRITLPFIVETHIHDKHNLGWRDSATRLLYVRLKAVVEQYTVQNDNNTFDIL